MPVTNCPIKKNPCPEIPLGKADYCTHVTQEFDWLHSVYLIYDYDADTVIDSQQRLLGIKNKGLPKSDNQTALTGKVPPLAGPLTNRNGNKSKN